MRIGMTVACLLTCALLAVPARADGSAEQQQLVALSDAWIEAEVRGDQPALERILDDRFRATLASSGRTLDRAGYIAMILGSKIEPFTVVNEIVDVHGHTALVISTLRRTKFTWVAVRKGGRWRVISETFSRMAEPDPAAPPALNP